MTTSFFMPAVNLMGAGCIQDAITAIRSYGFHKALIVTDKVLNQLGVAGNIQAQLKAQAIDSVIFGGAQPNPTVPNVRNGLAQTQAVGRKEKIL